MEEKWQKGAGACECAGAASECSVLLFYIKGLCGVVSEKLGRPPEDEEEEEEEEEEEVIVVVVVVVEEVLENVREELRNLREGELEMLSQGQDSPSSGYSSNNAVYQGAPCGQCRELCPAGYVPHFWR
ncbi:hypothetical protein HZH66_000221 [Vespula vulgaris]|uniref:Uncharacterized protein n=1 Tax=Vespula vulgaris TaxID=7454 RepID=A0A834KRT3_VESVU|nr:hypothetical protein HZH66_000221 [Vespula vulgaris]